MTLDQKQEARNNAWNAMEMAQDLLDDESLGPWERKLLDAIYESHWAIYLILCEEVRAEKRKEMKTDGSGGAPGRI